MQFVCIVNPVSGKGQALEVAHQLRARLKAHGHKVRVLQTSGDSETFEVICDAVKETDRVICIGGDGTLLYFLNHCERFHSVALYGIGTANVISVELGIPTEIDAFVAMLESDYQVRIHPGITDDGTRFLLMCSFGIDGRIIDRVSQRGKNRIGKRAFLWPFLRTLLDYRYPVKTVVLDGEREYRASFAIFSRIRHYGGSYLVTPEADPEGRFFAVVLYPRRGFWALMRLVWHLLRDRIAECPGVTVTRADEIVISTEGPAVCFQTDGDIHPHQIRGLRVLEETFPLVVPQPTTASTPGHTTTVENT